MSANDALLLIGHGSVRYPDAAGAMRRHAEALQAKRRFAQVKIAVLNGAPTVTEAIGQIEAPAIHVVPFFMEDGYFSRVAVPRAIAAGRAASGRRRIIQCPPVGVHDGMAAVIERQALAACTGMGVPSRTAAVVVIGHGSSRAPGRALALHRHTSRVAATGLFARVEAACLEEPPFVADVLLGLRHHPVVIVGFFANQGGHVLDDVPALIAAAREARGISGLAVNFHGSVTDDPAMVHIILDQSASAA